MLSCIRQVVTTLHGYNRWLERFDDSYPDLVSLLINRILDHLSPHNQF